MKIRLTVTQIIATLVLLGFVAPLAADLWKAFFVQPCLVGPNCYPWGAEGPVADIWSYASKTNYLVRGSIQLALLLGAGVFLALTAAGREPARPLRQLTFVGIVVAGMLFFV